MLQFPAILDGLKMNKDKSLTIKLETREMSSDEVGKIADLANIECWVGMSEVVISKLDIPDEIVEFKGQKTPSERLRNTLYILWEKTGKSGDFETYRNIQMDKIINYLKEKIPNE